MGLRGRCAEDDENEEGENEEGEGFQKIALQALDGDQDARLHGSASDCPIFVERPTASRPSAVFGWRSGRCHSDVRLRCGLHRVGGDHGIKPGTVARPRRGLVRPTRNPCSPAR